MTSELGRCSNYQATDEICSSTAIEIIYSNSSHTLIDICDIQLSALGLFIFQFLHIIQSFTLYIEHLNSLDKKPPLFLFYMPPTVHFVRHAQGLHNTAAKYYSTLDPKLTDVGLQQCRHLRETFAYPDKVQLVVASPLTRTLDTALNAFEPVIERLNKPVIAIPELQETGSTACDTGSDLKKLKRAYADKPVDLDLLDSNWNSKRGKWGMADRKIEERARVARNWLKARPEEHIVAVAHGGLLHYITMDWSDAGRFCGISFFFFFAVLFLTRFLSVHID